MDVRRGVLRCSSRKLRSSSFVELVAADGDRNKERVKRTLWCILSVFVTSTIKSKNETHAQEKNVVAHLASLREDE